MILLLFSGCKVEAGYFYQDRMAAEDATQKFHDFYNEQKFSEIYDLGAAELHQAVSRENFIRTATEGFARYGRFNTTKQAGTSCVPFQVRLVYLSEYENGPATELLAWTVSKGQAKLLMFNISDGHTPPTSEAANKCPS